ncbi:MAG: tRNA pseudouridine(55) synthase TruB [Flavobacteriales bacterium]
MVPKLPSNLTELLEGSMILIDKPLGWTSFDVVNKIKGFVRSQVKILKNQQGDQPRFKIGHAGTLDPLATGLLVVCTGKLTKQIEQVQLGIKEYTGTICFGQTTPSFDLETEPNASFPVDHLNLERIQKAAAQLTGAIWQTPPSYSAKQINGKRAYNLARKGIEVEIPKVEIHVDAFEITSFENHSAQFKIRCSKGTYIRSLADSLGKGADSGAHLSSLRRTESKPFRVEEAIEMDPLLAYLRGLPHE